MATSFAINKPFHKLADLLQKELLKQSSALRKLSFSSLPLWQFIGKNDYRIKLEPVNFHPVNEERIREFYNGIFAFGNKVIRCNKFSPFQIASPSRSFTEELHSFMWLSDLSAAKTRLAQEFAISMLEDWFENCKYKLNSEAWQPDIVAKRIIALLSNCKFLLTSKKPDFTKKFYKSLNFQYKYLYANARILAENEKKLIAYLGLYFAALCLDITDKQKIIIEEQLNLRLEKQIFADGGHISRNPQILVDLLLYMLALRYSCAYLDKAILPSLHNAIERMLPALKFFIHKDGSLARFNGVGYLHNKKLETIFTLDKTKGQALSYAPHSGYQRLEAGETLLIADIGTNNFMAASHKATASCLSFELSSGKNCFIVNNGIDNFAKDEEVNLGRSTKASSTASLDDSCYYKFIDLSPQDLLVQNKINIEIEQIKGPQYQGFVARHDGYKHSHGLWHERKLLLSCDGNIIQAIDSFLPQDKAIKANAQAIIRFHIHPAIELSYKDTGDIYLKAPGGDGWSFSSIQLRPEIEDSIFFGASGKAQACKQIVLRCYPIIHPKINWIMQKL